MIRQVEPADEQQSARLPALGQVTRQCRGWMCALGGADVAAQRRVLASLVEDSGVQRVGLGRRDVQISWTWLAQALRRVVAVAPRSD